MVKMNFIGVTPTSDVRQSRDTQSNFVTCAPFTNTLRLGGISIRQQVRRKSAPVQAGIKQNKLDAL